MSPPLRLRWRATAILAILFFAAPVLVDLAGSGDLASTRYVAADAYYYFTVARNAGETGRFSFDQETLTNGFHPLWQAALVPVFAVADGLGVSDGIVVTAILLINLACIAGALFLLARVLQRDGCVHPSFLLLPVGVVALTMSPMWLALGRTGVTAESPAGMGRPIYATLWSYVNGMESGFVLIFFAAASVLYAARGTPHKRGRSIGLGVILACLGLARLDHTLLPGLVLGWLLISTWKDPRLRTGSVTAAAVFAAIVGAYVVINSIGFGHPVPASGVAKSTFPHWERVDFYALRRLITGGWPGLGAAARVTQTVVPAIGAALYLVTAWRRRHRLEPIDQFLALTALAVGGLCAYNFAFVPLFLQGHWYYPMSSVWLGTVVVRELGRRGEATHGWWWVSASAIVVGVAFVGLHRDGNYHSNFVTFQRVEVPRIHDHYRESSPRFIAIEDGLIAFATGYPTMSGTGLALDREGIRAREQGRLLHHAVSRGFDRITSVQYLRPEPLDLEVGERVEHIPALRDPLERHFGPLALRDHVFTLDYLSESRTFVILLATPRASM